MRKHGLLSIFSLLLALFFTPGFLHSQNPQPWISGHAICPSILYQYRIEQRPGFHQQIHKVRIDLRGKDVSMGVVPSEGFPRIAEYPSEILKRTKSRVVVPASLFQGKHNGRYSPIGGLRFPDTVYKIEDQLSHIQILPLNHLRLVQNGKQEMKPPYLAPEAGSAFKISGINTAPRSPGLYLFTNLFDPIQKQNWKKWGVRRCYMLEAVAYSSDASLYWVRKDYKSARDVHIADNNYALLVVGSKRIEDRNLLKYRDRVRITLPEEKRGRELLGTFCGGPYFLREGKYDEEELKDFCSQPCTPPLSHYTSRKARLALARDGNDRYIYLFAVDQRGFSRKGMSLSELASFLIKEGIEEAVELPDGDLASMILPDGRANATPSGVEAPVISALFINERPPNPDKVVNILRRFPTMITACASELNNPIKAITDGSYGQIPSLDNYWEHISYDHFHKHRIMIDLLRPYDLKALEIFHAEEAGFSSHYNWRKFSVYAEKNDKNALEKILEVKNPRGLPYQRITFPAESLYRYVAIEVETPGVFEENKTARLAELALWGKKE